MVMDGFDCDPNAPDLEYSVDYAGCKGFDICFILLFSLVVVHSGFQSVRIWWSENLATKDQHLPSNRIPARLLLSALVFCFCLIRLVQLIFVLVWINDFRDKTARIITVHLLYRLCYNVMSVMYSILIYYWHTVIVSVNAQTRQRIRSPKKVKYGFVVMNLIALFLVIYSIVQDNNIVLNAAVAVEVVFIAPLFIHNFIKFRGLLISGRTTEQLKEDALSYKLMKNITYITLVACFFGMLTVVVVIIKKAQGNGSSLVLFFTLYRSLEIILTEIILWGFR